MLIATVQGLIALLLGTSLGVQWLGLHAQVRYLVGGLRSRKLRSEDRR